MDFIEFRQQHPSISSCENEIDACIQASINTNIKLIGKIISAFPNSNYSRCFIYACSHGQLNTAKYLVSNVKIDVHFDEDSAFKYSCHNNHYSVAKWLYSTYPEINYRTSNDYPLAATLFNYYDKIAKYLITLYDDNNIDVAINLCFKGARPDLISYIIDIYSIESRIVNTIYQAHFDVLVLRCQQTRRLIKSSRKI